MYFKSHTGQLPLVPGKYWALQGGCVGAQELERLPDCFSSLDPYSVVPSLAASTSGSSLGIENLRANCRSVEPSLHLARFLRDFHACEN